MTPASLSYGNFEKTLPIKQLTFVILDPIFGTNMLNPSRFLSEHKCFRVYSASVELPGQLRNSFLIPYKQGISCAMRGKKWSVTVSEGAKCNYKDLGPFSFGNSLEIITLGYSVVLSTVMMSLSTLEKISIILLILAMIIKQGIIFFRLILRLKVVGGTYSGLSRFLRSSIVCSQPS